MTHRLVCSGYASPGQSSRALLDSFSTGMLLDIALGMMLDEVSRPDEERARRQEFRAGLAELGKPAPEALVEVTTSSGRVVQITQERLEQLRHNAAGIANMQRR